MSSFSLGVTRGTEPGVVWKVSVEVTVRVVGRNGDRANVKLSGGTGGG